MEIKAIKKEELVYSVDYANRIEELVSQINKELNGKITLSITYYKMEISDKEFVTVFERKDDLCEFSVINFMEISGNVVYMLINFLYALQIGKVIGKREM